MGSSSENLSFTQFWQPRFWLTWLALAAMKLSALLPFAPQITVAKRLGRLLARVRRRSYRIAARNLEVCFPQLTAAERYELLAHHFESLAASLVEIALAWFGSPEKLRRVVEIEGAEHLIAAQRQGRAVILLAAHFTPIEIAAAALGEVSANCGCMYSRARNAMLEVMMRRGRRRFAKQQIRDDDVRGLLRLLKQGTAVVYLPDQTYLGSQSELLPFFGEPAMTNTATSKLARLTNAVVLPYAFKRLPGDAKYRVRIGAPLFNFPSRDARADTARLVALLEDLIREAPEQYLWIYRKFKGRPAPHPDLYGVTSR
jgi:Kdo2-lipid IVA lauroyltransferase/acyltransferase